MEWITDKKPTERESVFAKYYGSEKWKEGIMFRNISDDMLVTIERSDGERFVATAHTIDGKWINDYMRWHNDAKVVAWMPYPNAFGG